MFQTYSPKLPQLSQWAKFYSLSGETPILLIAVKKKAFQNNDKNILDILSTFDEASKCIIQDTQKNNQRDSQSDNQKDSQRGNQKDSQKSRKIKSEQFSDLEIFSFWGFENIQNFEKKLNAIFASTNQSKNQSNVDQNTPTALFENGPKNTQRNNQKRDFEDLSIFLESFLWSCLIVVKKETIAGFELGKMVSTSYGPVLNIKALDCPFEGGDLELGLNKDFDNKFNLKGDLDVGLNNDLDNNLSSDLEDSLNVYSKTGLSGGLYSLWQDKDLKEIEKEGKKETLQEDNFSTKPASATELSAELLSAELNKKTFNNNQDLIDYQEVFQKNSLEQKYLRFKEWEMSQQFLACQQISGWVSYNLKNISYCLFEPYFKDDVSLIHKNKDLYNSVLNANLGQRQNQNSNQNLQKKANQSQESKLDLEQNSTQKLSTKNNQNSSQNSNQNSFQTLENEPDLFKKISQQIAKSYQNSLKKFGFKKHYRKVYTPNRWILDIQKDPETLLKEMKKNTRYAIKQAQKIGIECDFAKNPAEKSLILDKFYKLLQKTAEKQVFYIPKKSHFENILNAFGDSVQIYWSYKKNPEALGEINNKSQNSNLNYPNSNYSIANYDSGQRKEKEDWQKSKESSTQENFDTQKSSQTWQNCLSMALICRDRSSDYLDGGCLDISYLDFLKNNHKTKHYQTAYYLWAASDPDRLNNKIPAQHPVLWHAILDSQKLGCTHFDFWGLDQNPLYADREGKSYGYDTFKIGFGGFYQEITPAFFEIKSFWRFHLIDLVARVRFLIMR